MDISRNIDEINLLKEIIKKKAKGDDLVELTEAYMGLIDLLGSIMVEVLEALETDSRLRQTTT